MRILIVIFAIFFNASSWAGLSQETIYLTWQKSPSTTMTIQWISPAKETDTNVRFRPVNQSERWYEIKGESFPFPHASKYRIHRVEIVNLQPDSEYDFPSAALSRTI